MFNLVSGCIQSVTIIFKYFLQYPNSMSGNRIRADFIVIGELNKHYLGKTNQLLLDFLKRECNNTPDNTLGFSSYWNNSQTTYTFNLSNLPDYVVEPKILMYDFPINFDDWRKGMIVDDVPMRFKYDNNPKLVCFFEYSLEEVAFKNLTGWFNSIDGQVQKFYDKLRYDERGITPKWEFKLLWDNGLKLFVPESFKNCIKMNEEIVR